MSKIGPSRIQRLLEEVEGLDISLSKKETIRALAQAELTRRQGDAFTEFREWIKRGDTILAGVSDELSALREMTSPEAEFVSLQSVIEVLELLKDVNSNLPYDEGRNWALEKAKTEICKLPKIGNK